MRNNRLTVIVRQAPDDADTFVAMFDSPALSSTFCLVFPDSIPGVRQILSGNEHSRTFFQIT